MKGGLEQPTWPTDDATRVPYWVYTDPDIYRRELRRIFAGPSWNYVALSCELSQPGDFLRTSIGETSVVVSRDKRGALHAIVNRCAHRGVQFCHEARGTTKNFTCPYHQWTYARWTVAFSASHSARA